MLYYLQSSQTAAIPIPANRAPQPLKSNTNESQHGTGPQLNQ